MPMVTVARNGKNINVATGTPWENNLTTQKIIPQKPPKTNHATGNQFYYNKDSSL